MTTEINSGKNTAKPFSSHVLQWNTQLDTGRHIPSKSSCISGSIFHALDKRVDDEKRDVELTHFVF